MRRPRILIVDDNAEKINALIVTNRRKGSPLKLVPSEKFEELLKDSNLKANTRDFLKKTFEAIQKEINEDHGINAVLFDFDAGPATLMEAQNFMRQKAKKDEYLFYLAREDSPHLPHLIIWTKNDLRRLPEELSEFRVQEQNSEAGWHELLMEHGADLIIDNFQDNYETLISTLTKRLTLLKVKEKEREELYRRTHDRNIETVSSIVIFSKIQGLTGIFKRLHGEPGKIAMIIDDALKICGDSIIRYGGRIHKYIGNTMMTTFLGGNTPYWSEPYKDAVVNSILSALQIQCNIHYRKDGTNSELWSGIQEDGLKEQKKQEPLFINIGIACGDEIIAGNFGHKTFKEYTLIGDAVNNAAFFSENASDGMIILDEQIGNHIASFESVKPISINHKKNSMKEGLWSLGNFLAIKSSENPKTPEMEQMAEEYNTEIRKIGDNLPLIMCLTDMKFERKLFSIKVYIIENLAWGKNIQEIKEKLKWKPK